MLLQLMNALGFAFLISELVLNKQDVGKQKHIALVLIVVNVLLSETVLALLSFLQHAIHLSEWFHATTHAGSVALGASAILTPVICASILLILLVFRPKLLAANQTATWKYFGIWSAVAALVYVLLRFVGANELLHPPEALRVLLAMTGFALLCFFDTRRFNPELTVLEFLQNVAFALRLVGPMFPFLAIGISTAFLFLVSVLERIGIDPHWLNSGIYYGTIYGPFAFVYFEVKKRSLNGARGGSLLPMSTKHPSKQEVRQRAWDAAQQRRLAK